jgi:large subunit ribosomal protein L15
MVKRKRKKVVKQRGSTTHGWGSKKKHRGSGSKGGKGFAGSKKHKKTWILKYKPDHLGKHGFKSLQQRGLRQYNRALNVGDLEKLAAGKKEIDITKFGYGKVLGGGQIKAPLEVRAFVFTEKAKAKIEKAKGKALPLEEAAETGAEEAEAAEEQ